MDVKSNLSVVSVLLAPVNPKVLALFSLAVLILFFHPSKSIAQTAINGSLETIGGQTVLNLWGTNYEMGYAHGFLMASKIRDVVDDYVVGRMVGGDIAKYNNFLSLESQYVTHYPEYLDEINGIAAGMVASGENLYVPTLDRDIDTRDIKTMNLIIELARHCQSYGVWDNASATGETIMARNLEFVSDVQGTLANNQMLITYEPVNGVKFVNFSVPGLYSVMSGFNEHGVSVMANAIDGGNSTSFGPFYPSTEVFRKILESTTPENYLTEPLAIVDSVEELVPFNIQIGAPQNGSGTNPVYYLEDSSGQNAVRYASDSNPGFNHIIGTNHFLKVTSPPPALDDSLNDYNLIENELTYLYENGDGKVDSGEAWSILGKVAGSNTLTSIVIKPDSMQFDVSFASMVDGAMTIAPTLQPQTYLWTNLFPNHSSSPPPVPLPDLYILSVVANPASPVADQPVDVTVTVKNQGTVTSGDFSLDFYSNQASPPTVNQVGDRTCQISALAAGATDTCIFTISYPTADNYRMWAQVDTQQQVEELNEANNILGQTITVSEPLSQPPTATVTLPGNGAIFARGETLNYAGDGTDPEDGILPAEAFVWSAVGNGQTFPLDAGVKSSAVVIPPDFEPGDYNIVLEVEDSQGSTDTDQVTITVSQ